MKKLIEAKYIIIIGVVFMTMMFVLFSLMSIFYMDRGYTIPLLFLAVITVVLVQKPDKENHLF